MNRGRGLAAAVLVGVSVLTAATAAGLRIWNEGLDVRGALPDLTSGSWAIDVLGALAWCLPGLLIARRRPDLPFGWLALVAAVGHGLAALGLQIAVASQLGHHGLPGAAWGLWFAAWGPVVELPVLSIIYVLFPDGRRMPGRLGRLSLLAPAVVGAGLLVEMASPLTSSFGIKKDGPFAGVQNPLTGDQLPGLPPGVPLIAAGMIASSAAVLWRWHRARGVARTELDGLAFLAALAPFVAVAVLALPARYGFAIGELETFLEIAVITAVVLRHQLFGIDVTLRRVAVYATLIFALAIAHAAIAAIATSFTSHDAAATIAAIAVALAVLPARDVLSRSISRLLYGSRDDPVAVLAAVSRTSTSIPDGAALLRQLTSNVATMMRLPFVAIAVAGDDPQLIAEVGARDGAAVREFPLVHQGRPLGVLLAQPRSGETALSTRDEALLEQVADQASIAVAATLMSIDVLRSRERLIVAVEDERRRLRRDVHDGLGPSLTASAFRLDTARALLTSRPEEADELISAVRADVATALNDIRRLVYDLRPPALDDLGLIGALRRQLDVPTPNGPRVSIDAPVAMPPMSAAVEVAAYRIVIEAVTNVRRHSTAESCQVIIRTDDQLRIEVCDDGPSVETWTAGVGLLAMSERTAEVGGLIAAGPTPHGGRVEVSLPLSGSAR
jgi:signal transduction histidine kinase